ncbi:hypothetical protein ACQU0X_31640 [Pseudovibrio ascidiaceicola]|uniref:hypothetical protein n=1 Tax=Pseudovibrio ascidiaceicola TaxID=285279 RepID=UPI003D362DBC
MTNDENTLETTTEDAQFWSDLNCEQGSGNVGGLDKLVRDEGADQQSDAQVFSAAVQGLPNLDKLLKERRLKTARRNHEVQLKAQDDLLRDLIEQVEALKGQYSLLEDLKVSLDQIGTTDLTHLAKEVTETRAAVWQIREDLVQGNRGQFFGWGNSVADGLRGTKAAFKSGGHRSVRKRDRLMGAALIVMAPVMAFLVIQTFAGSDTDSTTPQLSTISSHIEYIAKEQGVSLPQAVQITPSAQPVFIDPPVNFERKTSRLAAPEAIFKSEALAAQSVAVPLEPAMEPQRVDAGSLIKLSDTDPVVEVGQ